MSTRMPVTFVPHGGGPWPVLPLPFGRAGEAERLADQMRGIAGIPPTRPRALLVVSAHWEGPVFTLHTGASPGMLYDYGGFPAEAYTLRWPAPGAPDVAEEVLDRLSDAGIATARETQRGFDHGTFIPLLLAFPQPDIPVVQVSLRRDLDPSAHLALGRALAPLRDTGVFILGSGNSFHDLRRLFRPDRDTAAASAAFHAWLEETVTADAGARHERLVRWAEAPSARACHPREEHLIPLLVCAGAAGEDPGRVSWSGTMNGLRIDAHVFA